MYASLLLKDEDGYEGQVTAITHLAGSVLVWTADRLYATRDGNFIFQVGSRLDVKEIPATDGD